MAPTASATSAIAGVAPATLLANSRASEAYWPVKSIVLVVRVWRA